MYNQISGKHKLKQVNKKKGENYHELDWESEKSKDTQNPNHVPT